LTGQPSLSAQETVLIFLLNHVRVNTVVFVVGETGRRKLYFTTTTINRLQFCRTLELLLPVSIDRRQARPVSSDSDGKYRPIYSLADGAGG